MSFDIFFMPCRFGTAFVERTNPRTNHSRRVLQNDPLSASELAAVQELLKENASSVDSDPDYYDLRFPDGGGAEVHASQLETGCMVCLCGVTPNVMEFLFELIRAGNWVMVPAMENTVAIAHSRNSVKRIPERFPEIVVCESPEHLWRLIKDGFVSWKEYRDRVAGSAEPREPT